MNAVTLYIIKLKMLSVSYTICNEKGQKMGRNKAHTMGKK